MYFVLDRFVCSVSFSGLAFGGLNFTLHFIDLLVGWGLLSVPASSLRGATYFGVSGR